MKPIISLALVGALFLALPATQANAQFTFKRVRPPEAGATNRINIQIEQETFDAQSAPRPVGAPRPACTASRIESVPTARCGLSREQACAPVTGDDMARV